MELVVIDGLFGILVLFHRVHQRHEGVSAGVLLPLLLLLLLLMGFYLLGHVHLRVHVSDDLLGLLLTLLRVDGHPIERVFEPLGRGSPPRPVVE